MAEDLRAGLTGQDDPNGFGAHGGSLQGRRHMQRCLAVWKAWEVFGLRGFRVFFFFFGGGGVKICVLHVV